MEARRSPFSEDDRRPRYPWRYVLQLYVTGSTPRSLQAILNIKALCERYLSGRYDLDVIDVYQRPSLAREAHIQAVPTLVICYPLPGGRLTGVLDNADDVLRLLGLKREGG